MRARPAPAISSGSLAQQVCFDDQRDALHHILIGVHFDNRIIVGGCQDPSIETCFLGMIGSLPNMSVH